jgi:hypothetical protein
LKPGERWCGRFVFDVIEVSSALVLCRVIGIPRPVYLPKEGNYSRLKPAEPECRGMKTTSPQAEQGSR